MQPAMMMFSSKYWARRGLSLDSAVPQEHPLQGNLTVSSKSDLDQLEQILRPKVLSGLFSNTSCNRTHRLEKDYDGLDSFVKFSILFPTLLMSKLLKEGFSWKYKPFGKGGEEEHTHTRLCCILSFFLC